MTRYLLGAVLLIVAVYGSTEAWPLITGPKMTITSPADNVSFPDGVVEISGRVVRAAELTINGAATLRDQSGVFSSTLTFPRGGSILTFVATDRFGRSETATRTIFVP